MNISTMDLSPIQGLLDAIRKEYVQGGLRYGPRSSYQAASYDFGHWGRTILPSSIHLAYDHNELPYIEDHPLVKELWSHVKRMVGPCTLVRSYVNGYTFGTDAYYHQDDAWITEKYGKDSVSQTILIYLNPEWDRDWGGETTIIDENDEFLASTFPKRNRALVFDSNLWHRAGSLSRACPVLRSIIVFKTAGPQYNNPHVKWIKDKAENFDHLYKTAMIVDTMEGIPGYIVKAGLYHSIYNTADNITREEVREQIGEEAEELVHLFCETEDRYETFVNNKGNWGAQTHFGLLLLELANTIEKYESGIKVDDYQKKVNRLNTEMDKYEKTWHK